MADSRHSSKIFYGWYIVAACFLIMTMLWGALQNVLPIYLKPVIEDMGWDRGAFTFAMVIAGVTMCVISPVAGSLIDRLGARPVMIVGTLLIAFGLLAGSRITQLWQFYIMFAIVGCGFVCTTIVPCSVIVSNWFVSRRGTALSVTFVGSNVGGLAMAPVANWIILDYGWRTALVFSGVCALLVGMPVILFIIRTRPADMGLEPYGTAEESRKGVEHVWGVSMKQAFSTVAFWQIATIMLFIAIVEGAVGTHYPTYLQDLGHSQTRATYAWMIIMGANIMGRLCIGPIADRWGAKNIIAGTCGLYMVSMCVLFFTQPFWVAALFSGLFGFACGAPLILNPMLAAGSLGLRNFGAIYGILSIAANLGASVAPFAAGEYHDRHSTYLPLYYLFAGIMLIGVFIALAIKPAPDRSRASDPAEPEDAGS